MGRNPWSTLFPRPTEEERRRALADPGPSWSEWFYWSFLKTWVVLGFLIGDVFVIATWGEPLNLAGMIPSLVLATYAEILGYQYLWYRPRMPSRSHRRVEFRRTWLRPVPYGRWTPEAARVKQGLPALDVVEAGPDPREFL